VKALNSDIKEDKFHLEGKHVLEVRCLISGSWLCIYHVNLCLLIKFFILLLKSLNLLLLVQPLFFSVVRDASSFVCDPANIPFLCGFRDNIVSHGVYIVIYLSTNESALIICALWYNVQVTVFFNRSIQMKPL
jgi:hypothetical protein